MWLPHIWELSGNIILENTLEAQVIYIGNNNQVSNVIRTLLEY